MSFVDGMLAKEEPTANDSLGTASYDSLFFLKPYRIISCCSWAIFQNFFLSLSSNPRQYIQQYHQTLSSHRNVRFVHFFLFMCRRNCTCKRIDEDRYRIFLYPKVATFLNRPISSYLVSCATTSSSHVLYGKMDPIGRASVCQYNTSSNRTDQYTSGPAKVSRRW